MDSTSTSICRCGCEEQFQRKSGRLYVDEYHRLAHNEKRKNEIKIQTIKYGWQAKNYTIANKFFEVWGKENVRCTICDMSYQENLDKWNLPLQATLKPGINNYTVMDSNSWEFFCLRCFTEITFLKENI